MDRIILLIFDGSFFRDGRKLQARQQMPLGYHYTNKCMTVFVMDNQHSDVWKKREAPITRAFD